MGEFTENIADWLADWRDAPWRKESRAPWIVSIVAYAAFMLYAGAHSGQMLFVDNLTLVVHEGGHALLSWFGDKPCLWGGTLLQLFVPVALAAGFFAQRHRPGVAFSLVMFCESLLYTSVYMADARAQELPLVTLGDSDNVEHDFFRIFSDLGVLQHDTQIALTIRSIAWCGLVAITAWCVRNAMCPYGSEQEEKARGTAA